MYRYSICVLLAVGLVAGVAAASSDSRPDNLWIIEDHNPSLKRTNPERFHGIARTLNKAIEKHNLPEHLVYAVATQESHYVNRKGPTGEAGYFQIRPRTYEQYCGEEVSLDQLIYRWESNLRCGVEILNALIERYGENNALGIYNGGVDYGPHNKEYLYHVYRRLGHIKGWTVQHTPEEQVSPKAGPFWFVQRYRPELGLLNEEREQNIGRYVKRFSQRYDEDRDLMAALTITQSGLVNDEHADGSVGYMGLDPERARRFCEDATKQQLIRRPKLNIRCGIKMFSKLRERVGELNAIDAFVNGRGARTGRRFIYEIIMVYADLSDL